MTEVPDNATLPAPGSRSRVSRPALVAVLLLAGHVLALATLGTRGRGPLVSDLFELAIAVWSAVICYSVGRRSARLARQFWHLTGSFLAAWAPAELISIYYSYYLHQPTIVPISEALIFALSAAPLFVAVFTVGDAEEGIHWEWLLDAVQVLTLFMAVYLILIYVPSLNLGGAAVAPLQIKVLHWRNVLLVMALVGRALLDRTPVIRRLFAPVAAAMGLFAVGTWLANDVEVFEQVPSGAWYDLAWTVPFTLVALAAAAWRDRPEDAVSKPRRQVSSVVLLAYLPTLLLPALLLSLYSVVLREQIIVGLSAMMLSVVLYSVRLQITQHRERQRMEALQDSEQRYRTLFERNRAGVFRSTPDGHILDCNQAFVDMFGYTRDELVDQPTSMLYPGGKLERDTRVAALREKGHFTNYEVCYRRKDGSPLWVVQNVSLTTDFEGNAVIEGTLVDVTEQRLADREVAAWKNRYDAAVLASGQIIYDWDPHSNQVTFGGAFREVLGYASDDLMHSTSWWRELIHPFDLERYVDTVQRALEDREPFDFEYRVRRKDGQYRTMREQGQAVLDASGKLQRMVGFLTDVTEYRSLEQQFRQAQKMEAVGKLAGGIAHDFNNLLTVIAGYSAMQLGRTDPSEPLHDEAAQIKSAADRAAALTRQLLAFSRQQVLQPRDIDLNNVIRGMGKMLRALIGEDIEVVTSLAGDLGVTRADPGQVEQVVMNLSINARDAMAHGGKLTLETANAELGEAYEREHAGGRAGSYVMLAVTDNGAGMDEETKARIFEPFFTTKETGKGTGLGLSTVYGIVRQSEGHIWVDSEPGRGSTFRMYLPRVSRAKRVPSEPEAAVHRGKGSETILLVEDDAQVRQFANDALTARGYKVLRPAATPEEAETIAMQHSGTIDLLLTDVVMPGGNGLVIAKRIAQRRPGIKVLYMSGYTTDSVVHRGVLEDGIAFLEKPFTSTSLAAKVRETLDRAT